MILHNRELSAKKKQVRKAILDSALEMFSRYGVSNTSVSDISSYAGISAGTVYLYFYNKEDLVLHALNEAVKIILEEVDSLIRDEENSLVKFYDFFEASIKAFMKRPDIAKFVAVESFRFQNISLKNKEYTAHRDYITYIKRICDQAIAQGYIRELDTEILAYQCHAIVDYLTRIWLMNGNNRDIVFMKNKMLEVLVYGLLP